MDIAIFCADPMLEDSNVPHDREQLGGRHEECTSTITENLMLELEIESSEPADTEMVQSKPNLISALKGSRKQNGLNVENLTVTWSPDVYDPPITSRSHLRRQSPRSGKKSARGRHDKHTTKSSGAKTCNKKHYRKFVKYCYLVPVLPTSGCEMLCGGLSPAGIVNLAAPRHNLMCGNASFGPSLTDIHMSAA